MSSELSTRRVVCASLASLRVVGEGALLRRYARLVGAPNSAPSLCSVAGLLHALTLQSAYEGTLASRCESVTARASRHAFRQTCGPNSNQTLSSARRTFLGHPRNAARAVIGEVRELRRGSAVRPARASLFDVFGKAGGGSSKAAFSERPGDARVSRANECS
jgi:hypothetical protein